MSKSPVTASNWGAARIAVIALKDEIERDLAAGLPATAIYRKHKDRLSGLTVGAFQRQVRQIVKAGQEKPQPPASPQPQREGPIVVRPHRETGPVFTPAKHDDETYERLVGPRKPK